MSVRSKPSGPKTSARLSPSVLPWGIYVHVPWCRRRCPYCDFSFDVGAARPAFATRVVAELRARRDEVPQVPAATLSFGGGTPTALSVEEIAAVIDGAREEGALADAAEVAIEANPEDLSEEYVARLATAGITRLSIGAQSFDDNVLKTLGRAHTGNQVKLGLQWAQDHGLRSAIDLIVGVPGDGDDRLRADLALIESLGVKHVSTYLLTVEPGTAWEKMIEKGQRDDVDHDAQADALEGVQTKLSDAGLRQYEISSHAVPGEESIHNRLYWAKGHYLGLGPSAHSLTVDATGANFRRSNAASIDAYFSCAPSAIRHAVEVVPREEAFAEAVAFGLRDLVAGIAIDELASRHLVTSELVARVEAALDVSVGDGWVMNEGSRRYLTPAGARFADAVARRVFATTPELSDAPKANDLVSLTPR